MNRSEQAHTPEWEVGQHPAIPNGWIVRPVLFGANVMVLPKHEGGHAVLRSEKDARLIAAAPELLAALRLYAFPGNYTGRPTPDQQRDQARAAIAKAEGGAS